MPIPDRKINIKFLIDIKKKEIPQDEKNLSMDDMVTDKKHALVPDFVSKLSSAKKQ